MYGCFKYLLFLAFIGFSFETSIKFRKDPPRCGDWTPYNEEKCILVAEKAGHQTSEDADVVCESFSEELNRITYPRVLTVKTQEEQDFLHQFLFVESKIVDNVWLGIRESENETGVLEWNDGSRVIYTNWADDTEQTDDHGCVQMASGKGHDPAGKWVWVSCSKRNDVVCERIQTITLETLHILFLNNKLKLENQLQVADRKIQELETLLNESVFAKQDELNEFMNETTNEIVKLRENLVPVSFTYVQLPGQAEPGSIWPEFTWTDVSSTYAGLFFRVVGGNASEFNKNEVQEASTIRLKEVQCTADNNIIREDLITMPGDGTWSQYNRGGSGDGRHIRFRMSRDEIRPRNQAVKIWRRV